MKRILLATLLSLSFCLTSQAATQRSADFNQGQTLGVGLFGLSYDAGFGPVSLGLGVNAITYSGNNLNFSARTLVRFMKKQGLSAGVIAGIQFVPGYPGSRSNLVPDLGISLGYDLREHDWPWAVRMNMTLGYSQDQSASNIFQKIKVGPQSSLELAYIPNEDFEFTLGGGTFMGMRMNF